jgi:hypothetical protein
MSWLESHPHTFLHSFDKLYPNCLKWLVGAAFSRDFHFILNRNAPSDKNPQIK